MELSLGEIPVLDAMVSGVEVGLVTKEEEVGLRIVLADDGSGSGSVAVASAFSCALASLSASSTPLMRDITVSSCDMSGSLACSFLSCNVTRV